VARTNHGEPPVEGGDLAANDPIGVADQRGRVEIMTQIAAAVVGVVAFTCGVVAVFVTDNGAGSSALLAAGLVLLLIAAFGDRISKISGAGVEIEVRERAVRSAVRLERAAAELGQRGDDEGAASLRAEADALLGLAGVARPTASAYERVRNTMPASDERTRELTAIFIEARLKQPEEPEDASQLRELFYRGSEGERMYALGRMLANPIARDLDVVLDGIRDSRSAFEQYYLLELAEEMVPNLQEAELEKLATTLDDEEKRYLKPGTDRWEVAKRIRSKLRRGRERQTRDAPLREGR
jgi:hypothetical protein